MSAEAETGAMKRPGLMRILPFVAAGLLLAGVAVAWPRGLRNGPGLWMAWINIALMLTLAALALNYGWRLWRQREEPRPGSRLRAKLVMALVGMLLIPSMIVQISATQMVERGLNVWFDVRVDTLLDRALSLARGFYGRVESDLKHDLLAYVADAELLQALGPPADYAALSRRLEAIQTRTGWQRLQLFGPSEQLLGGVEESGLEALENARLDENAKLAMTLGRVITEPKTEGDREVVVGYAPLQGAHGVVGLLRAEVRLPSGVVHDARAVEADYRSYRELERNRQAIQGLFMHGMLLITLLVVMVAGVVALVFARRLTAPIGRLAGALHRITEGDLNVAISETSSDELGSLARSFNRMAARLRENVAALKRAQEELTEALNSSRARRQILETLLANLQTGVLLLDDDGRIRLLNEAMRELLQLPAGWIPGKDAVRQCHGRLHEVGRFIEELRHQEQERLQRELDVTVGRKTLHILARGVRLRVEGAEELSGYLIVMDDVSSLAEAQRHRAWAEVARRLAHEIKNPLTPIKLAAERLERRFAREVGDDEVFHACTRTIIGQVERLQRLITDFSTLARLPRPRIGEVSLARLMREMGELYAPYPNVAVEPFAGEATCMCDADQVRQVLINLLDNAIAATREAGGQVRVWAEVADDRACFHVEDTGEGIAEDKRDQVFEPYYSTKEEGSGLGLAIAWRIAQEHGGELALLSAARPTHFRLALPLTAHVMEAA